MPLVTPTKTNGPHTITAKQAARYSRASINTLLGVIASTHRELTRRLHHGADYTPAEYLEALGADAAELLELLTAIENLATKHKPGSVKASPGKMKFQTHTDGHVTILA